MRNRWLLVVILLCGCDDEARYADGTLWEKVVPVNPGRMAPKDMGQREWARFLSESGVQGADVVRSFTPTWVGFSSAPVGDISYMDFGAIVFMWRNTQLTGTSNDPGMSFSGVPEAIRPLDGNRLVRCLVVNGAFTLGGAAEVTQSGVVQFSLEDVGGGGAGTADDDKVRPQGGIFANPGTNGLPSGWLITYVK